jgi:hypothetical protein
MHLRKSLPRKESARSPIKKLAANYDTVHPIIISGEIKWHLCWVPFTALGISGLLDFFQITVSSRETVDGAPEPARPVQEQDRLCPYRE